MSTNNTTGSILNWFKKARPIITEQMFTTQIGVHFEEVSEMLMEMSGTDPEARLLVEKAKHANHNLAEYLKTNPGCIEIPAVDRKNYLDALCDQIVTAIGCAHRAGMDIEGAINHVNDCNWSKYDENGEPIYDANGKIAKGPNYVKPDLTPFV